VNGTGAEMDALGWDEFGNSVTTHAQKTSNPFGFTGYGLDPISNSHFAQAREYKSDVGRFISQDKIAGFIEQPFTLNAYNYCWNDPMNLTDLDGEYPWLDGIEAEKLLRLRLLAGTFGNYMQPRRGIPGAGRNGGFGFPDFVFLDLSGVRHVYELKSYHTYGPGRPRNAQARTQINNYVIGYQLMGFPAQHGTILDEYIQTIIIPSLRHPGRLIQYTIYANDPGLIYWRHICARTRQPIRQPVFELALVPEPVPQYDPVSSSWLDRTRDTLNDWGGALRDWGSDALAWIDTQINDLGDALSSIGNSIGNWYKRNRDEVNLALAIAAVALLIPSKGLSASLFLLVDENVLDFIDPCPYSH